MPRALILAACLGVPLATGGCSLPLISFQAKPDASAAEEEPAATGSIRPHRLGFGADLSEEDKRRAGAAMAVALDPQGNGKPVKWDNPETGARGAINPVGLPFVRNDEICRGFLASVVAPGKSRFLKGTSCRLSGGPWEMRSVDAAKAGA